MFVHPRVEIMVLLSMDSSYIFAEREINFFSSGQLGLEYFTVVANSKSWSPFFRQLSILLSSKQICICAEHACVAF